MSRRLLSISVVLVTFVFGGCAQFGSLKWGYDEDEEFFPITKPERSIKTAEFQSRLIAGVSERAKAIEANSVTQVEGLAGVPATGEMVWWVGKMRQQIMKGREAVPASLETMYRAAMEHSPQIRVFSDIPLIRETGVDEAWGRFVPRGFAEGKFERRNEPVGSTLTTGGDGRFRQREWGFEYGVRSRLITGAEATVSHRLRSTANNSDFFLPNAQSNSSIAASVVQPLLRGFGVEYNTSLIDLANIDTEVAKHEFVRQAESHLIQVNRAYWQLYVARAIYMQKLQLLGETREIVDRLENRSSLDADTTQRIRAKSALKQREAEVVRSMIAIENSQNRLRALTNDPQLARLPSFEILPVDFPEFAYGEVSIENVVSEAARTRAEVRQAYLQYEAASLRLGMAKNESRSLLDLVAEVSSNGLDNGRFGWGDAFTDGTDSGPSYTVGLRFEQPLGRDESRSRLTRRRRELRQQENQVKTTLNTVLLEAQVAVGEYATVLAELEQRKSSLTAARQDRDVLKQRWERGVGGGTGASQLEFLLSAQERTATAEERLVMSQASHVVAVANLERVKGSFLADHAIRIDRLSDRETHGASLHVVPQLDPADSPRNKSSFPSSQR